MSIILLSLAYLAVRKENKVLIYAVLATCIGAAAYFLFKVFRIYQGKNDAYRLVYKTLTVFCEYESMHNPRGLADHHDLHWSRLLYSYFVVRFASGDIYLRAAFSAEFWLRSKAAS